MNRLIPVFLMLIFMSAPVYADDFQDGVKAFKREDGWLCYSGLFGFRRLYSRYPYVSTDGCAKFKNEIQGLSYSIPK